MNYPAYGEVRAVSAVASVLLEENPSVMTLDGTNTWLLRVPGATECVIVDPGYYDLDHLGRIVDVVGDSVSLILLTHHHPDHAEGAAWLAQQVEAPVRAFDPELCIGSEPMADHDVISVAGLDIRVLHTPGHTDDSVCLSFGYDNRTHVLTGDTVLGKGTTVLSELGPYLRSLRSLIGLPQGALGLPGHGQEIGDLPALAREYLDHREQRLAQVQRAVRQLGAAATPRQIVELVYADVDPSLWAPAESSVRAQLQYLSDEAD